MSTELNFDPVRVGEIYAACKTDEGLETEGVEKAGDVMVYVAFDLDILETYREELAGIFRELPDEYLDTEEEPAHQLLHMGLLLEQVRIVEVDEGAFYLITPQDLAVASGNN